LIASPTLRFGWHQLADLRLRPSLDATAGRKQKTGLQRGVYIVEEIALKNPEPKPPSDLSAEAAGW
jgi:hypothetical protein